MSQEESFGQGALILNGFRVPLDTKDEEILELARIKMKRGGFPMSTLHFRLYKKSIDARHKEDITLVCSVMVYPGAEGKIAQPDDKTLTLLDAKWVDNQPLVVTQGNVPMEKRPLVVGMGPAGMFCALLLAENGYAPILIDRGDCVAERVHAVDTFSQFGILDTDSNIQFGAGGAGTFSDGKLLTRINDSRCSYVLSRLYEFGAPAQILTQAKPHIGTDVLRVVVDRLLKRVEECGGDVLYRTKLTDFHELPDGTIEAVTSRGCFSCSALILAVGHSARDTYRMLIEKQFSIVPKPLSVGVRIEHLQTDIDKALYGIAAGHPSLAHGEYALSDTRRERGVYTFCMCPGGQVVAAASEDGGVVVNGMSNQARDGKNANCAVAVSVGCEDYEKVEGNLALGAIAYQRAIEQKAYLLGGKNYSAPIQTVGDFLAGVVRHEPTRVMPTYRGGEHVCLCDLSKIFPSYITENLRYGLSVFDRKIKGFAAADAILTAPETRTSAPVRILRDEEGQAFGHSCVYPCGEGAGYAGGITSAAVDGIRTALAIMARFAPCTK